MAGIVPTKSNLMAAQKSLKLAKLGYELMDRKKNILIKELLSLAADAKTIRADTEKAFSEAYESLRHAEMTLGRCGTFAMSVPIDDGLSLSAHSVMGVELPDIRYKEQKSYPYFGFDCTNAYLDEAYRSFNKAKALAVKHCGGGKQCLPVGRCGQKDAEARQCAVQCADSDAYGTHQVYHGSA